MKTRTIVNLRLPLLLALMALNAIAIVVANYFNNYLLIVALIAVAVVLLFLCVKGRKILQSAIALAIFIVVLLSSSLQMTNGALVNDQRAMVQGEVVECFYGDEYTTFVLNSANYAIINENGDVAEEFIPLEGKVSCVVFGNLQYIDVASKIIMRCKLDGKAVFKDTIDGYAYKSNVKHQASDIKLVEVTQGELTFDQQIRKHALQTLLSQMPTNFGTAYALMFGDKDYMQGSQYETFRVAGLAHMFAVSGLHIGILAMALMKLLEIFDLRLAVSTTIVTLLLVIYGYVCGFPPSVVRAIIMFTVSMICRAVGGWYDLFNSCCLSMVGILLFKPFYIFDYGFLLSFGAVFGIVTVGRAINVVVCRLRIPQVTKYFTGLISMTVSATVGSSVMLVMLGNEITFAGIVSNCIVVPMLSVMFIVTALGLIPTLQQLLVISDSMIDGIHSLSVQANKLPLSNVLLPTIGVVAFLVVVLLFFIGGFVNIKGRSKFIIVSTLVIAIISMSAFSAMPTVTENAVVITDAYSGYNLMLFDEQSQDMHVFSNVENDNDAEKIVNCVEKYNYNDVYIHATEISKTSANSVKLLLKKVDITKIYYYDCFGGDEINKLVECESCDNVNVGSVTVSSIHDFIPLGLSVNASWCNFAIATTTSADAMQYFNDSKSYNFIYTIENSKQLCDSYGGMVFSAWQCSSKNNYGNNMYGNFTITSEYGTMVVNRGRLSD